MDDHDWVEVQKFFREAIKEALAAERKLIEDAIDKHARGSDHLALKAMIEHEARQAEREERRQKRFDQIRTTVIGGVVLGLLFWIGSGFLQLVSYIWKHLPHGN